MVVTDTVLRVIPQQVLAVQGVVVELELITKLAEQATHLQHLHHKAIMVEMEREVLPLILVAVAAVHLPLVQMQQYQLLVMVEQEQQILIQVLQ
jgi:hypothetical protein